MRCYWAVPILFIIALTFVAIPSAYAGLSSSSSSWAQIDKPIASDGTAGDRFGTSVAISEDVVIVGASFDDDNGSAYIFERNQGGSDNWGEVKKITALDGAGFDLFGFSVAISGDVVIVGAFLDDDNGTDSGSAYIFERNQGGTDNWGLVKKITALDGEAIDRFGTSVAISGDTVIVGATYDDDNGYFSGSAYIFERNQGGSDNWGQVKKITALDGAVNDRFGTSVAISGDVVIVGATFDNTGSGSAYIFERNQGGADNWGQVKKITALDGAADDKFGFVAISGDTVIVGAAFDNNGSG